MVPAVDVQVAPPPGETVVAGIARSFTGMVREKSENQSKVLRAALSLSTKNVPLRAAKFGLEMLGRVSLPALDRPDVLFVLIVIAPVTGAAVTEVTCCVSL